MKVGSGGLPGAPAVTLQPRVRCACRDPPGAAVPPTRWDTLTEASPKRGYHVQRSLAHHRSHSPSFQTPTRHWRLHPLGHRALAQLGPLPPGNRAERKEGTVADSAWRRSVSPLPASPSAHRLVWSAEPVHLRSGAAVAHRWGAGPSTHWSRPPIIQTGSGGGTQAPV